MSSFNFVGHGATGHDACWLPVCVLIMCRCVDYHPSASIGEEAWPVCAPATLSRCIKLWAIFGCKQDVSQCFHCARSAERHWQCLESHFRFNFEILLQCWTQISSKACSQISACVLDSLTSTIKIICIFQIKSKHFQIQSKNCSKTDGYVYDW